MHEAAIPINQKDKIKTASINSIDDRTSLLLLDTHTDNDTNFPKNNDMTETDQAQEAQGPHPDPSALGAKDSLESETEDEEVKRNCIMGFSGIHDSDFSTDMEEEDEDETEQNESEEPEDVKMEDDQEHLVQFVSAGQMTKPEGLFRPTPIVPKLATHQEESDEDASSNSEESEEEW